MSRQERTVNVETAVSWDVEHRLGEDKTVGGYYKDLRSQVTNHGYGIRLAECRRFHDFKPMLRREGLDG
jgi:hypothetical protein